MIKKLQALRAKKGFTLVELIVVIAIIGVLAAILVPTMMGMVTKSRVTSCDQTASSLKDTVTTWLADLDSSGGTITSDSVAIKITGKCKDDSSDRNDDTNKYGDITVTIPKSGTKESMTLANGKSAAAKLAESINNDYTFNNPITAVVVVSGRKVVGAAYCEGDSGTSTQLETYFTAAVFRSGGLKWGKTDGVVDKSAVTGLSDFDGKIIGTSPKLTIEKAS